MEIGLDAPAKTMLRTLMGSQCLAASIITWALDSIICSGLVGQTPKDTIGRYFNLSSPPATAAAISINNLVLAPSSESDA